MVTRAKVGGMCQAQAQIQPQLQENNNMVQVPQLPGLEALWDSVYSDPNNTT